MSKVLKYTSTDVVFPNGSGEFPVFAEGVTTHYAGTRVTVRATFSGATIAAISGTGSAYLDMPIQVEAQPFLIEQIYFMGRFDNSGGEFNIVLGTNAPSYNNLVLGPGDGWTPAMSQTQVAGGTASFYGVSEMVDSGAVVGAFLSAELESGDGVGFVQGTPRVVINGANPTGHSSACAFSAFIIGTSLQAQPFVG